MSNPYTQPTLVGYNANAPADDGTQTAANQVTWAKHKDKLGDPLKTFAQSVDTNVLAAFGSQFGMRVNSQGGNYTVQSSDQGAFVYFTGAATCTLLAAASAGTGFPLFILASSGTVTVDADGSETINGLTTITLQTNDALLLTCSGSNWFGQRFSPNASPLGHLSGMQTSNNGADAAHDIDVSTGKCRGIDDDEDVTLSSALTKRIDATFAAGTNQGGLASGATLAADTWYAIFATSISGVYDVMLDTDEDCANGVANESVTAYRRLGWAMTNASSDIVGYNQVGSHFYWTDPGTNGLDESNLSVSASESTVTLDHCPPNVEAILNVGVTATERAGVWVYPTTVTTAGVDLEGSVLPSVGVDGNGAGQPATANAEVRVRVDGSRQIHVRAEAASRTVDIQVMGWIDHRGKDD